MSESPVNKVERQGAELVRLDRRMLLHRHMQGDDCAFSELMQVYRAPVYSYIVRCGVPASAHDDLFQEVFIRVHQHADSYQAERPLTPWLFTIVANTVRSYYRKQRVRQIIEQEKETTAQVEHITGEDLAQARETQQWLLEALKKLPELQREVVLLYCIKELSQKDIAKILNLPVNTVKTHLSRARTALAQSLSRHNRTQRRELAS